MKPQPGEVRAATNGDRFYVVGEYTPDYDDPDYRHPTTPLTSVIQVTGQWTGQKFALSTELLSRCEIVSKPVVA